MLLPGLAPPLCSELHEDGGTTVYILGPRCLRERAGAWAREVVESSLFGVKPRMEHLTFLLAVQCWTYYLPSLILSFLIVKMGLDICNYGY
jgi:hypothetical protein